jgi:hypothetical protein
MFGFPPADALQVVCFPPGVANDRNGVLDHRTQTCHFDAEGRLQSCFSCIDGTQYDLAVSFNPCHTADGWTCFLQKFDRSVPGTVTHISDTPLGETNVCSPPDGGSHD